MHVQTNLSTLPPLCSILCITPHTSQLVVMHTELKENVMFK